MKKAAVIFDIDETLADTSHRTKDVKNIGSTLPKDQAFWDKLFEGLENDAVHYWCQAILESFLDGPIQILLVTGRPDKYREETSRWLRDKLQLSPSFYKMFMRPNDSGPTIGWKVKQGIYQKLISPAFNVLFAIDDDPLIIDMWNKNGVKGLYCGDLRSKHMEKL